MAITRRAAASAASSDGESRAGTEDQVGDAVADRLEGALGGVRQDQLGALHVADDAYQVGDLAAVGFDGEDQRHRFRFAS